MPDHCGECLNGVASVGMNLISVPSQLLEEAVVVLCMDVRGVRSGTVDGLHVGSPLLVMRVSPPKANRSTESEPPLRRCIASWPPLWHRVGSVAVVWRPQSSGLTPRVFDRSDWKRNGRLKARCGTRAVR